MRQYEAMFLFDPTFATDYGNVEGEIDRLMKRAGGEVLVCRKWDERKLAYEIKQRKRGCYVLCYFRAEPEKIGGLERDCQLSEQVLRVLVTRADDLSERRMEEVAGQGPAAARSDRKARAEGEGGEGSEGGGVATATAPKREESKADAEGAPSESTSESKSEVKPESKSESKSESRPEAKPE